MQINPQRLSRVFHNLIQQRHRRHAFRRQESKFVSRLDGDQEIVTEIEDSGPGIAPEIADRLFEAFATYGKANGTGLGLSICKKIVGDHKGRIYSSMNSTYWRRRDFWFYPAGYHAE